MRVLTAIPRVPLANDLSSIDKYLLNTALEQHLTVAPLSTLLHRHLNLASAMATLLILATPCIALMAPLIDPTISFVAVLAPPVTLIIIMTPLFRQTWNVGNHNDNEAVAEDAINIAHATFAALARDPGTTSASFRVVNGTVVHRRSVAGVPNGGDGSANRIRPEETGSGSQDDSGTDGGKMESWPELLRARCLFASTGADGSAHGDESEEVGVESQDDLGTEGGMLESWPKLLHAWGECSTSLRSREGGVVVKDSLDSGYQSAA